MYSKFLIQNNLEKNVKLLSDQNICSESKMWIYRYFATFIKSFFREKLFPSLFWSLFWKYHEKYFLVGWLVRIYILIAKMKRKLFIHLDFVFILAGRAGKLLLCPELQCPNIPASHSIRWKLRIDLVLCYLRQEL